VKLTRFLLPLPLLFILFLAFPSQNGAPKLTASPAAQPAPEQQWSCRILLGLTDDTGTRWDGSLAVSPGEVVKLEPWRFDDGDQLEGASAWKISTHQARAFGAAAQPAQAGQAGQAAKKQAAKKQAAKAAPAAAPRPIVANGVVATFRNLAPASLVRVETAEGNFEFRPADIDYGAGRKLLDGRVLVDRVPSPAQLTSTRDEQDYPAAAVDRDGNIWVAYLQFTPNPKFINIRMAVSEPITNFAELAEPTGGDRVFVMRYSGGKWSEPIAVSEPKGDLYKPAIAVDGTNRVWVFWPANVGGNFDIYGAPIAGGKPGQPVRLSKEPDSDVNPVAATDSQGQVWVAWQAFRGGRSQIRAARQQGASFSPEMVVASSPGNEWNPAIAASATGEVAIAWDSYRKGDYDVYFRTYDAAARARPERAAASSARFEAYPTVAYDPAGRLWIAWEESDAGWGKDFGAYETTGIALYHGRWIRVKAYQGEQAFTTPNFGATLPGVPSPKVDAPARQGDPEKGVQPDPMLAQNRQPSRVPPPPPRPKNSFPRLLADRGGRIWLAYRTAHPTWWTAVGTVWFENVVSFDGAAWSDPVFIPHSDNLLDNRPALASIAANELFLIGSADGRQQFHPGLRTADIPGQQFQVNQDPYNNDLYASRIVLKGGAGTPQLTAAASEAAPAQGGTGAETPDVRRLRAYRAKINGTEYRILRGEFHRHTEVSMDGGGDGPLVEGWRYGIDAAAMDWIGCCDHDNGFGREYTWWTTQKLTDVFHVRGVFTPMFAYERSVAYPEGHRNPVFVQRGVRTLPRLPRAAETAPGKAPDTQMLYQYMRHFKGILASHTSGTNMGTDWRDNDPNAEPVVEIYQGDRQNYEMPDAPRSNNENDSIGGWRPKGFVSLALEMGYIMGFQSSSDHISTHMSYCSLYTTGVSREAIMDAFRKRHVYGATADILADVRCGSHMMGDVFESAEAPAFSVKLIGTKPFAKVHIIKDGKYVYSTEPGKAEAVFTWRDNEPTAGKRSYYYVRGEQQDGQIVWVSPMWITYRPK